MAIFNKISHMIEQEYSSEENRGQENKQEKVRSIFDDRPVNPISVRPRIFNNTDDTITRMKQREEDRKINDAYYKYAPAIAALYASKKALENQRIQAFVRDNISLSYLQDSIKSSGANAVDVYGGRINVTNTAIEAARRAEELSPFSILRTFQMSHFLQPFASKEGSVFIDSNTVRAHFSYLNELATKYGTRSLYGSDIVSGLMATNGQLKDLNGNVVIENARIVTTEWTGDAEHSSASFVNRILRRYSTNIEDMPNRATKSLFDLSNPNVGKFTVIAGTSAEDINTKWIKAAAQTAVVQGFNMVNEPAAFIDESMNAILGEEKGIIRGALSKFKINPNATVDSRMTDLLSGYIREGAKKTAVAMAAYYALDNMSKVIGTESSGFDKGIFQGLATTYARMRETYAEVVGDTFSEYKEQQEYVAPKSTNLLSLAGLPLAGAMLGGTLAYGQRLAETATSDGGFEEALKRAQSVRPVFSTKITRELMDVGLTSASDFVTRGRRYATIGAMVGGLFALPFLPGALVGDNSDQVREEFFEGKKVAVRSNRGWFSGSTELEGGGVKYFAKNWYQRLMAGSKDEVLYGDGDTKDALNPFLHPFDYLRNPYRLEEMHKEDMPYPVWGMDVSYGGWAGKIFERTLGQIIKPDIINPELQKLQEGYQPDQSFSFLAQDGSILTDTTMSGGLSVFRGSGGLFPTGTGAGINIPVNESATTQSLIDEGLVAKQESLAYNPNSEAAQYTFNSAMDYIGLKGWALGGIANEVGLFDEDYSNQLARSGESTNIAREFMTWNLGGIGGAADVLRRIIPMSSSVIYDRSNPLQNSMAPSWLPQDESDYRIDFSKGNFWQSVERGEERLPGVGLEQYRQDLRGVDPEDYSDIDKYEVLADVAYGSKQYYDMSSYMNQKYSSGEMTSEEAARYTEIYTQTQERSSRKNFYEYKTDEELENVSSWGKIQNAIWEGVTHNAELPTEKLSFFRPAGKLLHQRTAIEDYRKTQILGTDTAMWNKPFDHFIKPFYNETVALTDPGYIPEETQERRNVDNYFDSLEYIKQMKVYRENVGINQSVASDARRKSQKTIRGAIASGLDQDIEIQRSYSALSADEKDYFTSFVNARKDDRDEISGMLDPRKSQLYEMLWKRKDAVDSGQPIESIVEEEDRNLVASNKYAYQQYQSTGDSRIGISFREFLQERQAMADIEAATGIPDEDFSGWDPRIDINDVKLRTLMVGKEDIRRYGYWESDEKDLRRQLAVLAEEQVTTRLNSIKSNKYQDRFYQITSIRDNLNRMGIDVHRVNVSNSGFGDFDFNIDNNNSIY